MKERPRRLSALIDSDTWGSVLRLRIRERRASWNVEGGEKKGKERQWGEGKVEGWGGRDKKAEIKPKVAGWGGWSKFIYYTFRAGGKG